MSELDRALEIARKVLDCCDIGLGTSNNMMADPDADIAVLARQLIRQCETIKASDLWSKP